jgi:hypothetical protein
LNEGLEEVGARLTPLSAWMTTFCCHHSSTRSKRLSTTSLF